MNTRALTLLAAMTALGLGLGSAHAATYNLTYSVATQTQTVQSSGTLTTNEANDTIIGLTFNPLPTPFPAAPFLYLADLVTVPTSFDGDDIWVPVSNTEGSFWIRYQPLGDEEFSGEFSVLAGSSLETVKIQSWGSFTSETIAPVPVPAGFPLIIGAFAALTVATRRRRA